MNCSSYSELMVDVLYGEEVDSRTAFEFFKHMSVCSECESEYLELLETREILGTWEDPIDVGSLEKPEKDQSKWNDISRISFWPGVQKVAAGLLMLIGLFALLQYIGIVPQLNSRVMMVSDEQLAVMIHDVMVEKQVEDWKVIASALLSLQEEIESQNRAGIQSVYQDMDDLRHRYVLALEDYNRQVSKLVNQ